MFSIRRSPHHIQTDNYNHKFGLFSWLFSCCIGHSAIEDYWEEYNSGQTHYNSYSINDSGMALSGGDTMWFDQSI